jgi:hypothetical protein
MLWLKTYFYETLNELKRHLLLWLLAYSHQTKLKSLKYHAPYDVICAEYETEPSRFRESPPPRSRDHTIGEDRRFVEKGGQRQRIQKFLSVQGVCSRRSVLSFLDSNRPLTCGKSGGCQTFPRKMQKICKRTLESRSTRGFHANLVEGSGGQARFPPCPIGRSYTRRSFWSITGIRRILA